MSKRMSPGQRFAEIARSVANELPIRYLNIGYAETVVVPGFRTAEDCFALSALLGDRGRVTGLERDPEMLAQASEKAKRTGCSNLEFLPWLDGEPPPGNETADVVISACLQSLNPDLRTVLPVIFRMMKRGGRCCLSGIFLSGVVPPALYASSSTGGGGVQETILRDDFLNALRNCGLEAISVCREQVLAEPHLVDPGSLDPEVHVALNDPGVHLTAITVYAEKPGIVVRNNYNFPTED